MHNQVATAGCTYQCGCKGTLNSTDRKPCPLLPVLLLLSHQLLLVQRQQPLSSPPFVLGFLHLHHTPTAGAFVDQRSQRAAEEENLQQAASAALEADPPGP